MGQAKDKQKAREEAIEFWWSVPMRLVKAIVALILCVPLGFFYVAYSCFEKDRWLWE